MIVIGLLGREVVTKIEALRTAQSDNVQWTLSRLEVDRLRLELSVEAATHDGESALSSVRRQFDLFYSRVNVVQNGAAYKALRQSTATVDDMNVVAAFLSETVPVIDGTDAELQNALPQLLREIRAIEQPVQDVALRSINSFAEASDTRRKDISDTLRMASLATAALMMVLAVLVFLLLRNTRLSAARANSLEETSTRLSTMISTSLDAIVVADTDGRVLEFNKAAETIFGYSRDHATGATMTELFIPDHHVAGHDAGMKRYLETGEKRVLGKGRVKLEAKRKSGEIFPVELSISSAITPEGEIFVSYLRDISARVAAETEIVKARDEALAGEKAKAKFMAIMSHEMRTPLNGIIGSLDLIRTTDLSETQRQYIEMMDFSGQRLLEHVNDVLDISKIEAEEQADPNQPMNLEDTLRKCIESQSSLAQTVGNTIDLKTLTKLPDVVLGDTKKVRRIMLNLLGNANKFTRRGQITVEAELLEDDPMNCLVELRVADTGIGIAEEDQVRIFDDFVTLDDGYNRSQGGTGLGLGITRRLVESLGGEIGLESEAGMGSVFWLRLPFERTGAMSHTRSEFPRAPHTKEPIEQIAPLNVLLVEDNQINQVVAQRMLEADCHVVTVANDGQDGVTLASQMRFDVVFMDISMPKMDGIEATGWIRRGSGASQKTPIVALTAHTGDSDVAAFRDAGMDDYLAKPVTRDRLRQTLTDLGFPRLKANPKTDQIAKDLEEMGNLLGPELAQKLNLEFESQLQALVVMLNKAPQSADPTEIAVEAHKVKGSAGVLGHTDLASRIQVIEADWKAADDQDFSRLKAATEAYLSKLIDR